MWRCPYFCTFLQLSTWILQFDGEYLSFKQILILLLFYFQRRMTNITHFLRVKGSEYPFLVKCYESFSWVGSDERKNRYFYHTPHKVHWTYVNDLFALLRSNEHTQIDFSQSVSGLSNEGKKNSTLVWPSIEIFCMVFFLNQNWNVNYKSNLDKDLIWD